MAIFRPKPYPAITPFWCGLYVSENGTFIESSIKKINHLICRIRLGSHLGAYGFIGIFVLGVLVLTLTKCGFIFNDLVCRMYAGCN